MQAILSVQVFELRRNNTKKTCAIINKLLVKNMGNHQIRDILVNGIVYHDECEIADGFNMYFTTVLL